ncbi:ABC transporter substrate-binding protein [Streptomyces sp. PSKA54]|uniref:ABC transporter substrate-binding protein n=1 Tax=Streptomyces himalayensis subsp. aureolus TaxID=2758039 RepID=A0A7W2D5C1_9ACTN|nr:ABC transporter substrate-binding protein [Streptomyces himalayensis]MBA4864926.1 ABC transporter substrate-binding protein [Streptomyces himalayensis subsp. aureolus]
MTGRRRMSTTQPAPPRRAKAILLAAGAVTACASVLAACGVLPGATGGSRETVTVMTMAPEKTEATNKPGMPAMAKAYARWVNANGGLGGRQLKVITCNDHNDTVGAGECAQRAVDEQVVAVVGSYSQYGRSFLAPLEGAGIPYIGGYGVTDEEFTSPLSYPVNGGQPALMAGLGRQLAKTCSRVSLVRPDTIAGDELPDLFNAGLAAGGRGESLDIRAVEDATDYTPQARRALERASADPATKGCVTAALGDRTDTFFDSFRRTRDEYPAVRIASVLGSVDQSLVDRTGGRSGVYEGASVTGWYPVSSDRRWDTMRKVINEYAFGDNRIDPTDAGVQTTWIAYTVLKKAVESLGDGEVTAQSLRDELDDGLKVTTGGLTPKLSWRFEDMIAARDFPRLVNAYVTFQRVRDGRVVSEQRGFVDMRKTLENE